MSNLLQDLRYALRMLKKNPGFTAVAVLTLALGIGANSAIFSVVNAVLLRPLPFQNSSQLVLIEERVRKFGPGSMSVPASDIPEFERQNTVFERVAGFQNSSFDLSGAGAPQRVVGVRMGHGMLPLLGVVPARGRNFTAEEDQPNQLVAMISDGLWQRLYGANPNLVGRTIQLDRRSYSVVGILPSNFKFPFRGLPDAQPADIFVPLALTPAEISTKGDNYDFGLIGRMKSGVTFAQGQSECNAIAARIQEDYPPELHATSDPATRLEGVLTPLQEKTVGNIRTLLFVLLGAVAFVLLIACANVSNLLLSRAAERRREIAIRTALGAGRWQLVRQMLFESVLLAVSGGLLGLLFAMWGMDLLVSSAPATLPRVEEIRLDLPVLAFTVTLSIVTGLFFGLVPALAASHTGMNEDLKEGGRTSAGIHRNRLRGAFVVSQVCLALVLVSGAGLLIRSFVRLLNSDPGFRSEHILTVSFSLPASQYTEPSRIKSFYDQVLEKTAGIPGVINAGFSSDLPLRSGWTRIFTPEGHPPAKGAALFFNRHSLVQGKYFQTFDIPLRRGRFFTPQDTLGAPEVLIISEGMARQYWPGEDAVGKRLKWGPPESDSPWLTIVGVVGDVKNNAPDSPTMAHTYQPFAQLSLEMQKVFSGARFVEIRTAGDPAALTSALRNQVQSLDSEIPLANVRTMDELLSTSLAPRRFYMNVLAGFAGVALLLAALGIYGVLAHSVAQRTHEIGVRMALGAQSVDVIRLVVGHGLRLTGIGLAIGLVVALGLTRWMGSLLYDTSATDPVTFGVVAVLLAGVACIASWIPARRASRVDPLVALRYE